MMADANKLRDANPWKPISNPVDLKHLGKFAEELNECGAAVARCIIQGVDEKEPVTGKVNREWLEDEIADVQAGCLLVIERFGLDQPRMLQRAAGKMGHLRQWHAMAAVPTEEPEGSPALRREQFTESEYFVLEAAVQIGFSPIDDDATVFHVTDEWLVEFARRVRESGRQAAGV